MPEELQNPEFWIDPAGAPITVSARDGKRLAAALVHHASPEANSAAVKITNAMHLGGTSTVELAIGEDKAVLQALEELQQSGDFLPALQRLLRDLKKKLDEEP